MQRIPLFITMGIFGMALSVVGGFIPFPMSIMVCMFGGFICLMAILQVIGIAKQKNFLMLYKDLEDNEKYIWIPDKNNKLYLTIMKSDHKDVLFHKAIGLFEDKGTEFLFGKDKMSFVFPESAYTADLKNVHYFSMLKKKDGLESWDDCVKKYLNQEDYGLFVKLFRHGNVEIDFEHISRELDWLINRKPSDELKAMIRGESIDFRSRCKWLKYNYDPASADNATEAEKIAVWKQLSNYKESHEEYKKYGAIAKAVMIIIFGIVLAIVVLSSVDLSNFIGLFGG